MDRFTNSNIGPVHNKNLYVEKLEDNGMDQVSTGFASVLKKVTLENAKEVIDFFMGTAPLPSCLMSSSIIKKMPTEFTMEGGKIYLNKGLQQYFAHIMKDSPNVSDSYVTTMHVLNRLNIKPSNGRLEEFHPKQIVALDIEEIGNVTSPIADGNLILHGTCDNQEKYENNTPLLLSKVNQVLSGSEVSSHIIDGPTITGEKFDKNDFDGLQYLLQTTMQSSTQPVINLNIIGHSRGACEAIAINNLFCLLVNSNFDVNAIPEKLSKYVTEDMKALLTELKTLSKTIDKENAINKKLALKLVLLDPVRGPNALMFNQDSYILLDSLYGIQKSDHKTKITLFTAQHETRSIMDLWFPKSVDRKHLNIDRFRVPTKHGHLIRYGTEEKEMGNSNLQNAIFQIVGFEEMAHKNGEYDKLEPKKYAKGSKRSNWSPTK